MPRPKKNKDPSPTRSIDTEQERQLNTYQEYVSTLSEGFMTKIFNDGIIKELDAETIQKYLANPDKYQKELEKIAQYQYISNGDVFQLFDLTKILPTLNYKIEVDDKTKNYEKNLNICKRSLNKVRHRTLTRDIITQEITAGTVTGIWLGDKKNPYLYIFPDVEYAFPAYRKNGDWVVWVDLEWFDTMSETERESQLENLSPYITQSDYDEYTLDPSKVKYIELPIERSVCLRTHTLKRNQRLGIPWVTQGLFDIIHKKKLKDLEKSIANKIINSVAVLTIGNEEDKNLSLKPNLKKKVYGGVRAALEKNQSQGVTVIAIPEWSKLEFPDIKSKEALDPKKFETINDDITSGYGYSQALTNGTKGNFASAKLNLDIFYKRISVLLEEIEEEVYGKLFKLILPSSVADSYRLVYDKETPLNNKEKIDVLQKLHSEGFAIKPILDLLPGIDFAEYIDQSLYELEVMKLHEKIKPYQTSHTIGRDNKAGAPSVDDSTNDNTIRSKTIDGNSLPRSTD